MDAMETMGFMETKLRVCPFCGGKAEFIDEADDWYSMYATDDEWVSFPMRVQCTQCGANIQAGDNDAKEDVIHQWNIRPILGGAYGLDCDDRFVSIEEVALRLLKLIDKYNQYEN